MINYSFKNEGPLFIEFNRKVKFGDQLINLQNKLENWGIYNLDIVMISRVLMILASQNRCQSLFDELLNIDIFLE